MMPLVAPAWLIVFPLLVLLVHFSLNSIKSSHKCGAGAKLAFNPILKLFFTLALCKDPWIGLKWLFRQILTFSEVAALGFTSLSISKEILFETLLRFSCFRSDTRTLQQQQHAVAKKKNPTWKLSGGTTREKNSNLEEEENCLNLLQKKGDRFFICCTSSYTWEHSSV